MVAAGEIAATLGPGVWRAEVAEPFPRDVIDAERRAVVSAVQAIRGRRP